jgi:threonine/homoserine/homoserine lactone efflux protein
MTNTPTVRRHGEFSMIVEWSTLLTFALGSLALTLIPGPNVMFIVSQSVGQGRRAGIFSALGVEVGSIVHVTAAVLGLSALLASSATAVSAIKVGGAVYLVYLGIRALLAKHSPISEAGEQLPRQHSKLFLNGFFINVFNPKVALFFVAFLPQFVDPNRGSVSLQLMVLGMVFCAVGLTTDATYALISGTGGAWLRGQGRFGQYQRFFTAGVYFALAAVAATTKVDRSVGQTK